ncbi:MAG: hypothetical protein ACOYOF_14745, partial [Verrucomicrobiaceae bacterium]
ENHPTIRMMVLTNQRTSPRRGLAGFAPVARGVAGELFEHRAEALPRDEVAQLEDAGAYGGNGLLVLNGAKESSSSLGLAVAFYASYCLMFQTHESGP